MPTPEVTTLVLKQPMHQICQWETHRPIIVFEESCNHSEFLGSAAVADQAPQEVGFVYNSLQSNKLVSSVADTRTTVGD
jgi:hypothetical protein